MLFGNEQAKHQFKNIQIISGRDCCSPSNLLAVYLRSLISINKDSQFFMMNNGWENYVKSPHLTIDILQQYIEEANKNGSYVHRMKRTLSEVLLLKRSA